MSQLPSEQDYIEQVIDLLDGVQKGRNSALINALLGTLLRHYSNRFGPRFTSRDAEDALKSYQAGRIKYRAAKKTAKIAGVAAPPKPIRPRFTPEHFIPIAVTVRRLLTNDFDAEDFSAAGQRRVEILRHLIEGAVLVNMLPSEAKKLDKDSNFKALIPSPAKVIQKLSGPAALWRRAKSVEERKQIEREFGPTDYLDRYTAMGIYCDSLREYLRNLYK